MIYVSQGHESGIGLEVFLKAFCCLTRMQQSKIVLITNYSTLEMTLSKIFKSYKLDSNQLRISGSVLNLHEIKIKNNPTIDSLLRALEIIEEDNILLTLPSSKNQFKYKNKQYNGYTEFFRKHYDKKTITMNFISHEESTMLLSDHVSISEIPTLMTEEFIIEKTIVSIEGFKKFRPIDKIYFSGIDPHCGENGNISHYDDVFKPAIEVLRLKYPQLQFFGPYPADTLHYYKGSNKSLFIYSAHDQGLAPFKQKYGVMGINLSLGLPFIRVSVDHGTAFELFGRNMANYQGMLYLLDQIVT